MFEYVSFGPSTKQCSSSVSDKDDVGVNLFDTKDETVNIHRQQQTLLHSPHASSQTSLVQLINVYANVTRSGGLPQGALISLQYLDIGDIICFVTDHRNRNQIRERFDQKKKVRMAK